MFSEVSTVDRFLVAYRQTIHFSIIVDASLINSAAANDAEHTARFRGTSHLVTTLTKPLSFGWLPARPLPARLFDLPMRHHHI